MANILLSDLISSASGVISRRRLSDGSVKSLVINKHGRMYSIVRRPRPNLSDKERHQQLRFAAVSAAIAILRREYGYTFLHGTLKPAFRELQQLYDGISSQHKTPSAETLASVYNYNANITAQQDEKRQ